jgi:hypothetical protein
MLVSTKPAAAHVEISLNTATSNSYSEDKSRDAALNHSLARHHIDRLMSCQSRINYQTTGENLPGRYSGSSVQAQFPTERAPFSSQRCLVSQRPHRKFYADIFFFSFPARAAWLIPIVRASNEESLQPRVARAQVMIRPPLAFFVRKQ